MDGIYFTKLAEWQEKDCLYCDSPATLQANADGKDASIAIRCCTNNDCKCEAKKAAKEIADRINRPHNLKRPTQ
jgi:hypothetical protein